MSAPGSGVVWASVRRRNTPVLTPSLHDQSEGTRGIAPGGLTDQDSSYLAAAEVNPQHGGRIDRNPFQSTATRTGGFKEGKHQ
jgi:hypothetical protein